MPWQKQHSAALAFFAPANCASEVTWQVKCIWSIALYGVEKVDTSESRSEIPGKF